MIRFGKALAFALVSLLLVAGCTTVKRDPRSPEERYSSYVWPPPPDQARIRLVNIFAGRADLEGKSALRRRLIAADGNTYDSLQKPFAVEFDDRGRILVTDTELGAIIRFDRSASRYDVFGTRGQVRLQTPVGLGRGRGGSIFVADSGIRRVVEFGEDGSIQRVFGEHSELTWPTDVVLSPEGDKIYVADAKAHEIVVFEVATGQLVSRFGRRGTEAGEFNFPTALGFGPEGDLYVVDSLNHRLQLFSPEGDYLDQFGQHGIRVGNFVRPKDVAVDDHGLIYVTDAAFNNIQLFDFDFALLTFLGRGGQGPGEFRSIGGVAVQGDLIAVVDQLNRRVQLLRFVEDRIGG